LWLNAEKVAVIVDRRPAGHEVALAGAKNTLGYPLHPTFSYSFMMTTGTSPRLISMAAVSK
jgi:hypothetical protein